MTVVPCESGYVILIDFEGLKITTLSKKHTQTLVGEPVARGPPNAHKVREHEGISEGKTRSPSDLRF